MYGLYVQCSALDQESHSQGDFSMWEEVLRIRELVGQVIVMGVDRTTTAFDYSRFFMKAFYESLLPSAPSDLFASGI